MYTTHIRPEQIKLVRSEDFSPQTLMRTEVLTTNLNDHALKFLMYTTHIRQEQIKLVCSEDFSPQALMRTEVLTTNLNYHFI